MERFRVLTDFILFTSWEVGATSIGQDLFGESLRRDNLQVAL